MLPVCLLLGGSVAQGASSILSRRFAYHPALRAPDRKDLDGQNLLSPLKHARPAEKGIATTQRQEKKSTTATKVAIEGGIQGQTTRTLGQSLSRVRC